MGGFPSGQRGQTVNLLAMPSKVRILLRPLGGVNQSGWNPSPPIRRSKPKRLKSFSAHCVLMRAIRTVPARMSDVIAYNTYAAVAELADAQDLKSCGGDIVPVRFRSAALILSGRSLLRKGLLLFFYLAVERAEENSLQINRKVLY